MTPDIEQFREPLEAALAYTDGAFNFEDVKEGVATGKYQYWPGEHSVVVTELQVTPHQKHLVFFLAGGGNLAELESMTPKILEWGRLQGCTHASFFGRPGWERSFLTRTGWNPRLVVFNKELSDGR